MPCWLSTLELWSVVFTFCRFQIYTYGHPQTSDLTRLLWPSQSPKASNWPPSHLPKLHHLNSLPSPLLPLTSPAPSQRALPSPRPKVWTAHHHQLSGREARRLGSAGQHEPRLRLRRLQRSGTGALGSRLKVFLGQKKKCKRPVKESVFGEITFLGVVSRIVLWNLGVLWWYQKVVPFWTTRFTSLALVFAVELLEYPPPAHISGPRLLTLEVREVIQRNFVRLSHSEMNLSHQNVNESPWPGWEWVN